MDGAGTPDHTLPPLLPERALVVELWVHLIEARLGHAGRDLPGRVATRLLDDIMAAPDRVTGAAQVEGSANGLAMTLCGIRASSRASASELLRDWAANARLRLAAGRGA